MSPIYQHRHLARHIHVAWVRYDLRWTIEFVHRVGHLAKLKERLLSGNLRIEANDGRGRIRVR
jgi:hypothetical protein